MVSLKWGIGEFGIWGVRGARGVWEYGGEERHPAWEHTYQLRLCVSPVCCVVGYTGVAHWGGGVIMLH